MASHDLVETLNIQSDVISRLIQEAEASVDEEQRVLLYGMARDECENIIRSLRSYLGRKLPGHQRNAA